MNEIWFIPPACPICINAGEICMAWSFVTEYANYVFENIPCAMPLFQSEGWKYTMYFASVSKQGLRIYHVLCLCFKARVEKRTGLSRIRYAWWKHIQNSLRVTVFPKWHSIVSISFISIGVKLWEADLEWAVSRASLRLNARSRCFYTLTWTHKFLEDNDTVYFVLCISRTQILCCAIIACIFCSVQFSHIYDFELCNSHAYCVLCNFLVHDFELCDSLIQMLTRTILSCMILYWTILSCSCSGSGVTIFDSLIWHVINHVRVSLEKSFYVERNCNMPEFLLSGFYKNTTWHWQSIRATVNLIPNAETNVEITKWTKLLYKWGVFQRVFIVLCSDYSIHTYLKSPHPSFLHSCCVHSET